MRGVYNRGLGESVSGGKLCADNCKNENGYHCVPIGRFPISKKQGSGLYVQKYIWYTPQLTDSISAKELNTGSGNKQLLSAQTDHKYIHSRRYPRIKVHKEKMWGRMRIPCDRK